MVTGIILAGGKSSRMGKDKCLLKVKNKKLISNILMIFETLTDEILISANKPEYENFGYSIIPDEYKDCGPLGGIVSALQKSSNDVNIIAPCDMPMLRVELFEFLLSKSQNFQAVVPIFNKKYEPLTIILQKNTIDTAISQLDNNDFKMMNFLRKLKTNFVEITDNLAFFDESMFLNINRLEDLTRIIYNNSCD